MNLFESIEASEQQNSLDLVLGLKSGFQCSFEDKEHTYEYQISQKNCVTYQWVFSDADPQSPNSLETEESQVEEMKTARIAQQQKIQQFLSQFPSPHHLVKKISTLTQQPTKKKRIRKPKRN